jgi:hypothetical protein
MTDVSYFSERSPPELRAQAAKYRHAAKIARGINVREVLIEIAARFEDLADQREQEQGVGKATGDE